MTGPPHNGLALVLPPEAVPFNGAHRKEDERPPSRWWIAIIALVGLLAVTAGVWLTQGAGKVEDQLGSTAAQAQDLGRLVTDACSAGQVVQGAQGQNLCQRAAQVQSTPVPDVQGPQGERGPAGASVVGPKGDPGPAGGPGPAGPTGAPGKDSTVAGPTGPAGATGPAGTDGVDGRNGTDGKDGRDGPAGKDGAKGDKGDPGANGRDGTTTCPDGSALEPVTFASGQDGLGCVTSAGDPTPPTTTTEPPIPGP